MASSSSRICRSSHAILPSHCRSSPSPPYIIASVSLFLYLLPLLLPLASTYHRSRSLSPPPAATLPPHHLLHCRSPFSSPTTIPPTPPISTATSPPPPISHPIAMPLAFPFPLPLRPEVAYVLYPQLVSLSFSSTRCHSPSSLRPPLLLLPLLSHCRSSYTPISTVTSPPPHIPSPRP